MTTESCMTVPKLRMLLPPLAEALNGAQLCDGARELGLRLRKFELVLAIPHGLLRPLPGRNRRGFIQIMRPDRRIGEHRHEMRLNLQSAAADVERLLLLALGLYTHLARLERG